MQPYHQMTCLVMMVMMTSLHTVWVSVHAHAHDICRCTVTMMTYQVWSRGLYIKETINLVVGHEVDSALAVLCL